MVIPSTLKADTALPFSLKSLLGKELRDNGGWEVAVEMSDPVKVHTFALYSHDYRVGDSNNGNPTGTAAVATVAALLHLALIATLMIIVWGWISM